MDTAITKLANSPTRGSTPVMMEKAMASGISASATTSPDSTSMRATRGLIHAGRRQVLGRQMTPHASVTSTTPVACG